MCHASTPSSPPLDCYSIPLPPSPTLSTVLLVDDVPIDSGELSCPPPVSKLPVDASWPLSPFPPLAHKRHPILYIPGEIKSDSNTDTDTISKCISSTNAQNRRSWISETTPTPTPLPRLSIKPHISRFIEHINLAGKSSSYLSSLRRRPARSRSPSASTVGYPLAKQPGLQDATVSAPLRRNSSVAHMWKRTRQLFVPVKADAASSVVGLSDVSKLERPKTSRSTTSPPALFGPRNPSSIFATTSSPLFRSASSAPPSRITVDQISAPRPSTAPLPASMNPKESFAMSIPVRISTGTFSSLPSLTTSSSGSSRPSSSTTSPTTPSRSPLALTVHTGGSIFEEMKEIIDNDSRWLTEVAFM